MARSYVVSLLIAVATAAALNGCNGGSRAMIPPENQTVRGAESTLVTLAVPRHLPTMAYDQSGGQGATATQALVRRYVTYAESGLGDNKPVYDCRGSNACSSVFYFLANFVLTNGACTGLFATGVLKNATESWYMHESGFTDEAHRLIGHRVQDCNGVSAPQPVYALNNANPGVEAYTRSYLRTSADLYDYILMDETSALNWTQFYGPGAGMCPDDPNSLRAPYLCFSTEETPTNAALVQAHERMFSALTHSNGSPMRLFFNGVTLFDGHPTDLNLITQGTNLYGAMCEDCVVSHGKFRPGNYPGVMNAMAVINTIPNASFIQLNLGNSPAGSSLQIGERLISVAMAWLGYSPGHTITFPDFEYSTNRLAVWPEYNIVPASPLESMRTSFSDIQVGYRVYRREFAACYNFGTLIGQCAAIVNGKVDATITVDTASLKQHYGHVIVLSGGDIPAGGKALLTSQVFDASTTSIPPGHAVLLVR